MKCTTIYYHKNKKYRRCNHTAIPGKMVCPAHYKSDTFTEESFITMDKSKYTIGGQLAAYAQHWTAENHKKLGDVLYRMLLGNKETRAKARTDYFLLRKSFMEDEWEEYITRVDNYRSSLGAKTFTEFMIESYSEMFNINSAFNPAAEKFILPDQHTFMQHGAAAAPQVNVSQAEPEQCIINQDPSIPEEGLQLSFL